MRTLRARLSRLERQANDAEGADRLVIALLNDDGTYSVNGTTMTEEEFASWSKTLKPDQVVLILDF